jgi:hypothetical protein
VAGVIANGETAKSGFDLRQVRCHADSPEFRNHSLRVVVLAGTQGFLVGTGDVTRPLGWVGWALDLRARNSSGSLLEMWVLLLSLMLWKCPFARFLPGFGAPQPSSGPVGGGGGSSCPTIRSSEAWKARACSRVPFTEKRLSVSSSLFRISHQLLQELPHHSVIEKPLAVLGECGRVPEERRGSSPHTSGFAVCSGAVLEQQPFLADLVERLQ